MSSKNINKFNTFCELEIQYHNKHKYIFMRTLEQKKYHFNMSKYNREMEFLASYLFTIFLPLFFVNGVLLWNGRPLGRVVLLLLVVYADTSSSSSCSIFGSPYLSKSCSLATPSIPMIFLLPLLTTT